MSTTNQNATHTKTNKRRILVEIGIVLTVAAVAVGWSVASRQPIEFKGRALDPPAQVAGLSLTDQYGRRFDFAEQAGKALVVYFGYTHCPDACPATLMTFTGAKAALERQLGRVASDVEFLFVTVDPERDTPEELRSYLDRFDGSFIGLTGSPEEVARASEVFGVYAEKVTSNMSQVAYLMNHTAAVFVVDPAGLVRVALPFGSTVDDLVHDVQQVLRLRNTAKPDAETPPAAGSITVSLQTAGGPAAGRASTGAGVPAALRAEGAWVRPAGAGANSALYVTLVNEGARPETLVSVRTSAARVVEIHETRIVDGVMRMGPVEGVEVPAGGRAELKPGGLHVMLIDLQQPLEQGQQVQATLVFSNGIEIPVTAQVRNMEASHQM